MRMLLLTFSLIFVFTTTGLGQKVEKPIAYKFADVGAITSKQMSVKMKAFYDLVREGNASGYVMNFGTPRAIRDRKKLIMGVTSWRGYDPPRITFVDGSVEKKIRTAMWVVPLGAENPKP